MNKFSNDSNILSLQHKLDKARANTRSAENEGQAEDIILYCMDQEDDIISQLLRLGCDPRDC